MPIRHLFTPSSRNRLRLFFVVIVIIPMIAVAMVLFRLVSESQQSQTDAQLSEAQRVAQNVYAASSRRASAAGQRIVADVALRRAVANKDAAALDKRLQ